MAIFAVILADRRARNDCPKPARGGGQAQQDRGSSGPQTAPNEAL